MVGPEDVQGAARPLTDEGERDAYIAIRQAFQDGPEAAARVITPILMSNPDKGPDGVYLPFEYQVPVIGHTLFQTWDAIDALFPTGMGKTEAVSVAMALRMFFGTENAAIISYTEEQTRFIRDRVHSFYEFGHPMLRSALMDAPNGQVRIRRPNGEVSNLFCKTANLNNEGKTLLGVQGLTTIILDERSIIPDAIFFEKIDRITAPQGRKRLLVGITTTQEINHVYDWVEADLLPKREACDAFKPHITKIGGAVFKSTWRDGVKEGRYTMEFIERRHRQLGEEQFASWYECDFPSAGLEIAFPPDLLRSMVT